MYLSDVDRAAVAAVVAKMPDVFHTRDVSEHPEVVAAHPQSRDWNYHAMIGKALARMPELVRRAGGGGGRKGVRWVKVGRAGARAVAGPVVRRRGGPGGGVLGPQYAGDDAFRRRMRLHQSWYRAFVLERPYGTGPGPRDTSQYGNMLTQEDGAAGRNFLTPQIFEVVQRRIAQGTGAVEPYRLLHNMLSSQPMCFNLFGPLADDLDLATRLTRALWGKKIAKVTHVAIEWAPSPKRAFLDDNTAFDAFIEYVRDDGGRGFIGIETKLTEPFSRGAYDKPAYRRWMTPDGPWRSSAARAVAQAEHNQLWRDHLLAWALLRHEASPYAEGRFAVIYHPQDRRCAEVIERYRGLLRDPKAIDAFTLAQVVEAWRRELEPGSWLDAFHTRYLDLARSEQAAAAARPMEDRGKEDLLAWFDGAGEAPMAAGSVGAAALFDGPGGPTRAPGVLGATGHGPVRRGHLRCLEQLEHRDAYRRARALYRNALGGVDVYLRPTDNGFTVLALDAKGCRSMIGVGGRGTKDHLVRALPPDPGHVERAVRGYLEKRRTLRRASHEERYALELIDHALKNHLVLPRGDACFVTQEWRLPSGDKIDILAVRPRSRRLVVVELKASAAAAAEYDAKKGGDAREQAKAYARELYAHRAVLYPFFQRLFRALARHHGAPPQVQQLELDPDAPPEAVVAWPGRGVR